MKNVSDKSQIQRIKAISEWLPKAQPGERLIYHTGHAGTLPRALAEFVCEIADEDRVHVFHVNHPQPLTEIGQKKVYEYTLVKASDWWHRNAARLRASAWA